MDIVLNKVIVTINSCETQEQLNTCKRLIQLYLKRFKENIFEYNELNKILKNKRYQITINDKTNNK